jgi:hypothetical protein
MQPFNSMCDSCCKCDMQYMALLARILERLRHNRKLMLLTYVMYAERNQNFADDAQKALKKGQQIVVYCGRGGTLTTGIKGRRGTFDDPDRCHKPESSAFQVDFSNLPVSEHRAPADQATHSLQMHLYFHICRQFGIESRSLKACYELLEVKRLQLHIACAALACIMRSVCLLLREGCSCGCRLASRTSCIWRAA